MRTKWVVILSFLMVFLSIVVSSHSPAADLIVGPAESITMAGTYTFETIQIHGEVVLTGNTCITVTGNEEPDTIACIMNNAVIKWEKLYTQAQSGENGSAGTYPKYEKGESGQAGLAGEKGCDLSITVRGDMVVSGQVNIRLNGQAGGNGGNGGLGSHGEPWVDRIGLPGGDGGNGGSGGSGGNFKLMVEGKIYDTNTDTDDIPKLTVSNLGGAGGNGGSGGNGGFSSGRTNCDRDTSCASCAKGSPGGKPGEAGSAGQGGNAGNMTISARNIEPDLRLNLIGGNGGNGGSGGDGGVGGIDDQGFFYNGTNGMCCGSSYPGIDGAKAAPGGNGGNGGILFLSVGCEIDGVVYVDGDGGNGGNGGRGGKNGRDGAGWGTCFGVDGADGQDGGRGGQGGRGADITIRAVRLNTLDYVDAEGGNGGAGGQGGSCDELFDGYPYNDGVEKNGICGNGGQGGTSGPGGRVRIIAKEVIYDDPPDVTDGDTGKAGAAGLPGYNNDCIKGQPGLTGLSGGSGEMIETLLPADHDGFDIFLDVDKNSALTGDMLTYTIFARTGDISQANVSVNFNVPLGTQLVSASNDPSMHGNTLIWSFDSLSACESKFFQVGVVVNKDLNIDDIITAEATGQSSLHDSIASDPVSTVIAGGIKSDSTLGPERNNSTKVHDPVDPATGNLVWSKNLLDYPGRGLSLLFSIHYNSLASDQDGSLGFGWTHSYFAALDENPDSGLITIRWGDGHKEYYQLKDGIYQPVYCISDVSISAGNDGSLMASSVSGITYLFDADHLLSRISDRNGNSITLSYTDGVLTTLTDSAGRNITLSYENGRLTRLAGPLLFFDFKYDTAGNLKAFTDALGRGPAFTYDTHHRLLTQHNGRGQLVLTNTYDDQGRISTQKDAFSNTTTFAYSFEDDFHKTTITPPAGNPVVEYFNASFSLVKRVDGGGDIAQFTYSGNERRTTSRDKGNGTTTRFFNDSGFVTQMTDANGHTTTRQYNAMNLPVSTIDPLGNISTMEYDEKGNLTKSTDPLGNRVTIICDALGQPTSISDELNNTWLFSYTAQGRVAGLTDPDGHIFTYAYDAEGRLTQISYPDETTTETYVYDAAGFLKTKTDALGRDTTYEYDDDTNLLKMTFVPLSAVTACTFDPHNRLTSISDPENRIVSFSYNENGKPSSITDPDGVTVSYTYDAANRLNRRRFPDGNQLLYAYDAAGNQTGFTDQMGNTSSFVYDKKNQFIGMTMPSGAVSHLSYDDLGRVIAQVDRLGRNSDYTFDKSGRLTQIDLPGGRSLKYVYDAADNLTGFRDALDNTWTFDYNTRRMLEKVTDPLNQEATCQYDGLSRISQATDRSGQVFNYAYDSGNRLISADGPGLTTHYTYHDSGQYATITGDLGTLKWVRDKLGRAIGFTNQENLTMAYHYTAGGKLETVTYPGGRTLTYNYNNMGKLSTIKDWQNNTTTYSYHKGRLIRVDLPNGSRTLYEYDVDGHIAGLRHEESNGSLIAGYVFKRDAAGRIISEDRNEPAFNSPDAATSSFVHDGLNRVNSGEINGSAANFTYDKNGNLLRREAGEDVTTYGYDAINRLISITRGAQTYFYQYDPLGNRVLFSSNAAKSLYLIDQGRIWAKYDQDGTLERFMIYGTDGLVYSLAADNRISVYHGDIRGSVIAVTDASQKLLAAYSYDPYGNLLDKKGSGDEFCFLGRHGVISDDSGLCFTRTRVYVPELSRFLQEDPIGLRAGPNRYVYGSGDPINSIDPSGLDATQTYLQWEGAGRDILGETVGRFAGYLDSLAAKDAVPKTIGFMNWAEPSSTVNIYQAGKATSATKALKFLNQSKILKYGGTALTVYDLYGNTTSLYNAHAAYYEDKSLIQVPGYFYYDLAKGDIKAWEALESEVMFINGGIGMVNPLLGFGISRVNDVSETYFQDMIYWEYSHEAEFNRIMTLAKQKAQKMILEQEAYLQETDQWIEELKAENNSSGLNEKP